MKTLKTVLVIALFFLGANLSAQGFVSSGLKVGLSLSDFSGVANSNMKMGFNAGLTLDYAFSQKEDWLILTGIEYVTKGVSFGKVEGVESFVNLGYAQIPIHLGYQIRVSNTTKLTFHGGAYLAYGLTGSKKQAFGGVFDGNKDPFSDNAPLQFKRFDFGAGLGTKVEFGKIGVGLGWDFGMMKILDQDFQSIKNQNGYLTIGYLF